ncbi:hypothetical protein DV737_g44, partial [Chaetothyriales sp. CBS 132003]
MLGAALNLIFDCGTTELPELGIDSLSLRPPPLLDRLAAAAARCKVNLRTQKRLAASVVGCGERKIWLDPNEVNEISNANSRQTIRKLVADGLIIRKPVAMHSRARARALNQARRIGRHRGYGKRKGTKDARMPSQVLWMRRLRVLRRLLVKYRSAGKIDKYLYHELYQLSKGNTFKHKRALVEHIHKAKAEKQRERVLKEEMDAKRAKTKAAPPTPEFLLPKERAPPARPVPLELPRYSPNPPPAPLSEERMRQLRQNICGLKRPSDVSDALFGHFNVRVQTNVPLEEFVPQGQFEQRPFLFDSDLASILKELDVENEDAFREVLRMPPLEGRTKPRLAFSRNFFAALEDLSRYWDDSKDEYFEIEVEAPELGNREANETEGNGDDDASAHETNDAPAHETQSTAEPGSNHSSSFKRPGHTQLAPSGDAPADNKTTPARRQMYRGHRLGNSAQTPQQTRVSTARNFAKMFSHRFNCRDYDPGPREKLKIKDILLPPPATMYTFNISRVPSDRNLAKARLLEGPLLSVYCRHEVIWKERTREMLVAEGRPHSEFGDFVGEEFDFMRELGGLLVLAVQRAREDKGGKDEHWKQETADWWWSHKPRWGGGSTKWGQLPSEIFEDEDPSWSPAERELQRVKREKEERDKDLERQKLKQSDAQAASTSAAAATPTITSSANPESGGSATSSRESTEKPAKKRTRLGLPDRMMSRIPAITPMSTLGNKAWGDETAAAAPEFRDGKRLAAVSASKKRSHNDWQVVRPNTNPWDSKVIYKSIGRPDGQFDHVFQIGFVGHHLILNKMSVSKRYLHWLDKGTLPLAKGKGKEDDEEAALSEGDVEDEDVIHVQRSKWYDLFEIDQRKDFLIGIWRIMCWLNRNDVPQAEFDKMEQLRLAAD